MLGLCDEMSLEITCNMIRWHHIQFNIITLPVVHEFSRTKLNNNSESYLDVAYNRLKN